MYTTICNVCGAELTIDDSAREDVIIKNGELLQVEYFSNNGGYMVHHRCKLPAEMRVYYEKHRRMPPSDI